MLPAPTSHSPAIGPGVAGPPLAIPSSFRVDKPAEALAHIPTCGARGFAVEPAALSGDPRKHTQDPYVTGTSVLGVTFKDGVLIAADTLGSYGSTKRYKSVERIFKVNANTILAASGEVSDFQYIQTLLQDLVTDDYTFDDGVVLAPNEVHAYLNRVMYNRRNKFDPLWNSLVVGGVQHDGTPFLGTVGMIGTSYTDQHIATGFGQQLARPLFRERHRPDMSKEEATQLLKEALKVLFYRDKQSINKYQIATVTKQGVTVSEPFALETKWDYKGFVDPTRNAVGAW